MSRFLERSFWSLPSRREFRIRVFDGRHEVLAGLSLRKELDLESPTLNAELALLLAQAAEQANLLENEPMDHPRLEVWCEQQRRKVKDFLPGLGGLI